MKTLSRALTLAVAVLLGASGTASAHAGNPNFRSVIDNVKPALPAGVSLQVIDFDSFFQLTDHAGKEVTVYGYQHEPYARILPHGTVQINQRSPAAYLNETASRRRPSRPAPTPRRRRSGKRRTRPES